MAHLKKIIILSKQKTIAPPSAVITFTTSYYTCKSENPKTLNFEVVEEISKLRSEESKLILFWNTKHGDVVKVNSIQSIIAVQRVADDLTNQRLSRFDYNIMETQEAFLIKYERLLGIAKTEQYVKLNRATPKGTSIN